jgi:hypothetical protein
MVAWLKPLALALLFALLAHLLALSFIHSQMPLIGGVLEQYSEPLFTRTISSASMMEPAPKPPPSAEAPKPVIPVQVASSQPLQPSPTLAETPMKQSEPNPAVSLAQQASETITHTTSTVLTTVAAATTTSAVAGSDSFIMTGEWPTDTRVSYQLSGFYLGDLHGSGRVQWSRHGNQREKYQVRVEVRIPGLYKLNMTSQGRVSPLGLLPEAYEETVDRTGAATRLRTLRLEAQDVVFDNGDRSPRPTTETMAVQDAVSQFIDLGHRFTQARQRLEPGQAISVWLGRPGGLDEWIYDVNEAENLHLPRIGEVQVYRLRPRPLAKPRGPLVMEMWLAPSLQYLPAKIRITLDAQSYIELTAIQIEQN